MRLDLTMSVIGVKSIWFSCLPGLSLPVTRWRISCRVMLRMLNMRNNCRLTPSGGISLEPVTGSQGLQKTPAPVVALLTPDETRTMLKPLGGCGSEHGGLDERHADGAAPDDDVDVAGLLPLTQLCVQTEYTAYRLTILDPAAATVMIQGGRRFAVPTPARIEGATLGAAVSSCWACGWRSGPMGGVSSPQQFDRSRSTIPIRLLAGLRLRPSRPGWFRLASRAVLTAPLRGARLLEQRLS